MASIEEELRTAKAAKAVISTLSTTIFTSKSFAPLQHAYRIAVLHLSNEGPLDEARRNVGIALSNLMHRPMAQEKIDKAKGAVDEWISQLRAA